MNHHVNVRGATGVVAGVDGGNLYDSIRVGVPATTEKSLRAVEIIGGVTPIEASCIC